MRYRDWLMGAGLALTLAGSAVAQGTDHMHMGHAGHQGADTPATREFKASHERMMQGMMVPYTGDPDVDFRLQMIPHHQGAIEMAQVAMKHAKDPWSRQLAESIIVEQQREIAQMRAWLGQHGVATPASGEPTHIIGAASYRSLSNEAGTRNEAVGQSWAPGGGVR
ncbi:DUF305 domain-containing protein [Methylobacterium sp. J-070]|uniref:CopM family metallochaperone n=1 Tax=Methylobacterium sp. J-070 TaxID=2836650 RepID=UPI00244382DD|nr:DUF305 domain-containing protein [Methylobacterium sp. J-070]